MRQLSFLSMALPAPAGRALLDPASEGLLATFQQARLGAGAHRRSVAREISQIRAIAREAGGSRGPVTLPDLIANPGLVARALCEPSQAIARTTGRARLVAVQRLIQVLGPVLGSDPGAVIACLDRLLPARQIAGWHTAGTMVAGSTGRRLRGPTLSALDLRRIVDAAAGAGPLYRDVRNAALVALACFSGLRAEEIVAVRWEDLSTELTPSGYYGLTATLGRTGRHQRLPIPAPAAEALSALAGRLDGTIESLAGPVLRASERSERALSYRAARGIIRDACLQAGLQPVESVELRAACAYWLRTQGLSDHEVAAVLGLARVRTVDRLLSRHAALDAQRRVREACHA